MADPTLQIDQIEVINGANGGVILWGANFIAQAESDYPGSYMVGLFSPTCVWSRTVHSRRASTPRVPTSKSATASFLR
jgi:hypothetical protein